MKCSLCTEPITGTQSRVMVYFENPLTDTRETAVALCHRTCAAKVWPDTYEDRPNPK